MQRTILLAVLMALLLSNYIKAQSITITSPVSYEEICADGKIRVEWKYTGDDDFNIRIVFQESYSIVVADSIPVRQGYAIVGQSSYFRDFRPFNLILKNSETREQLAIARSIVVYNKPMIYEQSEITEVCKNHPLKLFVKVDGDFYSISWYKDGKILKGAKAANLWIPNPGVDDNGVYKCVLNSNATCGNTESKEMRVSVVDGPDIVQEPEDVPFVRGRSTHFRVKVHLTPEDAEKVKFQWWKDSVFKYIVHIGTTEISLLDTAIVPVYDNEDYAGTNSDYLSVNMATVWAKANYYCQVITDWGCTFSKPARVLDWFDVVTLKNRYDGCSGNNALFEVKAVGIDTNLVSYQWYKSGWKVLPEGDKFKGTKTRFLKVLDAQPEDNGVYYCRITDPRTGYYANSRECLLYAKQKPVIKKISGDYTVNDHDNKFYGATDLWASVDNEFNDLCNFDWYKDGKIVGECMQALECHYLPYEIYFRPAKKSDTGKYVCHIYNQCGDVWTDTMSVTWGYEDVTACLGRDALIKADKYENSDDYSYKWEKSGKELSDSPRIKGANSNTLGIIGCDSNDVGEYHVTAVNKYNGSEYPLGKIYLKINEAPKFTRQPNDTVYSYYHTDPGDAFGIYAASEIKYQFYLNGNPIRKEETMEQDDESSSATSGYYIIYLSTLDVLSGGTDTLLEGNYQLRVWNDCGEIWSKVVTHLKHNSLTKGEIKNNDGTVVINNSDEKVQEKDEITGINDFILQESYLEVYPNPATSGTTIEWFNLGETDDPVVEIYNSYGSKIIELKAGGLSGKGAARFYWNGKDSGGNPVPSGLYFAKIISHGVAKTIGIMVSR